MQGGGTQGWLPLPDLIPSNALGNPTWGPLDLTLTKKTVVSRVAPLQIVELSPGKGDECSLLLAWLQLAAVVAFLLPLCPQQFRIGLSFR